MTRKLVVLGALVALAGCQETDEQLRSFLVANCPAVEKTYAIFATAAAVGISSSTVTVINNTKATFDDMCTNPETATTFTAVAAATAAMAALRKGIAEAEAKGADVGYPVEMRQLRSTLRKMERELRNGR